MDLKIVLWAQSFASELLNGINSIFSKIGEENFILLIFACIYLFISKKQAFKFGFIYLVSAGVNSVTKDIIKRDRPFVANPEVKNMYGSTGYSLPSGHAQSIAISSTFLGIQTKELNRNKVGRIFTYVALGLLSAFVCFSRIYFGQHYLTDVLAGLLVGFLVCYLGYLIINALPNKIKNIFTLDRICIVLLYLAPLAYCLIKFGDFVSTKNLIKVYKIIGMIFGVSGGYFIETRFIKYDHTKYSLKSNIYKLLVTIFVFVLLNFIVFDVLYVSIELIPLIFVFFGLLTSVVLPYLFVYFSRGSEKEIVDDESFLEECEQKILKSNNENKEINDIKNVEDVKVDDITSKSEDDSITSNKENKFLNRSSLLENEFDVDIETPETKKLVKNKTKTSKKTNKKSSANKHKKTKNVKTKK